MEPVQEIKNSLSENWTHQREVSDEVILLREKVRSLEEGKILQWRFISGVIVSFILAIFYFGAQSATIENNTSTLVEHDVRIREIGPQINDALDAVNARIDSHKH